jgi:hypothetical protein
MSAAIKHAAGMQMAREYTARLSGLFFVPSLLRSCRYAVLATVSVVIHVLAIATPRPSMANMPVLLAKNAL